MKELIESDKSVDDLVNELTERTWSGNNYYGEDFTAQFKQDTQELLIITDMEDVGSPTSGPELAVGGPGKFVGVDSKQVAEEIVKEIRMIGIDNMTSSKEFEEVARDMGVKFESGGELPF